MPKVIPSKTNRWATLVARYLWSRGLFTAVGAYFLFSIILYATTGIDICIPCIWYTIFGVHCPGCGLTKAFIYILQLDFASAWNSNPLAFVVAPAGIFFLYKDISRFLKREVPAEQVAVSH
jgi:hypothetical protein